MRERRQALCPRSQPKRQTIVAAPAFGFDASWDFLGGKDSASCIPSDNLFDQQREKCGLRKSLPGRQSGEVGLRLDRGARGQDGRSRALGIRNTKGVNNV